MAENEDPAASFAALMAGAAEQADATAPGPAEDAPYGYTRDRETGEQRPKKAAGRPRRSPSLDELKAERESAAAEPGDEDAGRAADRAPQAPKRGRRGRRAAEDKPKEPVPQFREGQIEKGVNRLYRKAGRILRVWDPAVGQAVIETTIAEDDDDITVGRAWEDVCRHNPAVRRVVMKFLKGGAYGQLFWAHAPILLAILMKDAIRERIPFGGLMSAFLGDDDDEHQDGEGAPASPFAGVSADDMQQAMAFAQQMMPQMFAGRGVQMPRTPEAAPGEAA